MRALASVLACVGATALLLALSAGTARAQPGADEPDEEPAEDDAGAGDDEGAPGSPAPDEPVEGVSAPATPGSEPAATARTGGTAPTATSTTTATTTATASPVARTTTPAASTAATPASTTAPAAPGRAAPREQPVHEQDDGRAADFIWFEVEGGYSYVDLIALRNQSFSAGGATATAPGFVETRGSGPMVGAGGGFRLSLFALGVRGTFASYGAFDIGTIGGEVHLRIPTPVVEPYIRIGAGYAWQGNANYSDPAASAAIVHGWTANGAVGIDVFVTWWLTLGVGGQVDFLNMTRQHDPTLPCMGPTDFCPMQDGDAVGVQGRGYAQVGLHF